MLDADVGGEAAAAPFHVEEVAGVVIAGRAACSSLFGFSSSYCLRRRRLVGREMGFGVGLTGLHSLERRGGQGLKRNHVGNDAVVVF